MTNNKTIKTSFIILTVIMSVFIFSSQVCALFGPKVVDVTTRKFSVCWTRSTPYTSCNIALFRDSAETSPVSLDPEQKIIETNPGNKGEDGKKFGLGKITVTGLDYDSVYYFRLTIDSSVYSYKNGDTWCTVRTERLRGFDPSATGAPDIPSNDIVHKSVYKNDGASPAFGAMVLLEIVDQANQNVISHYPISGWVGYAMTGDKNIISYDPNNLSYRQYAALDMNNFFGSDRYPLIIEQEGAILKYTVVHGTQLVYDQKTGQDYFIRYGKLDKIDKINNQKISTPRILTNYKFRVGFNPFTIPSATPTTYKAKDIYLKIEDELGGKLVRMYVFQKLWGGWKEIYRVPGTDFVIDGDVPIGQGDACFANVTIPTSDDKELSFYGDPLPHTRELRNGTNIFTIPQCPVGYTSSDMWLEIEKLPGIDKIEVAYVYINGWRIIMKYVDFFPIVEPVSSERICAAILKLKAGTQVVTWRPASK